MESGEIQTTLEVVILEEKRTIEFPWEIGQQLQIEKNKALMSDGSYALLTLSSVNSSLRMLDIVDAFSHMSVVIPDLLKLMNIGDRSVLKLTTKEAEPIVELYNGDYARFYNQFVIASQRIGPLEVQAEAVKHDKKEEEKEEA